MVGDLFCSTDSGGGVPSARMFGLFCSSVCSHQSSFEVPTDAFATIFPTVFNSKCPLTFMLFPALSLWVLVSSEAKSLFDLRFVCQQDGFLSTQTVWMTSHLTKGRGKILHSDPEPGAPLGSLMSEEAAQSVSQLDSGQKVKNWKASSCVASVLECQMWGRGAPPRSERFDSRWSTNPPPDLQQGLRPSNYFCPSQNTFTLLHSVHHHHYIMV